MRATRHSGSAECDPDRRLKRWIVLLIAGAMLWGMSLTCLFEPQEMPSDLAYYITLQFVPRLVRVLTFVVTGAVFIAAALYQLNRRLLSDWPVDPVRTTSRAVLATPAVSTEPAIVVIGGGHGLSTLLRGLKQRTSRLTGIVTVADDGGSSGILRRGTGMLPPGDLRRCIAALSEAEPLTTLLFQYRFGAGAGLDGHAFGNLFIAALAQLTGDFVSGVGAASRVLAAHGRLVPASLDSIELWAEIDTEKGPALLQGQSRIARSQGRVERVYIRPEDAKGYPEAIQALLQADLIVLGPGSLFTSILPNLLVSDIRDAIRASEATKVYVCNVATQPGETDGFAVWDHVRALEEHLGAGFCSFVLANSVTDLVLPTARSEMVQLGRMGTAQYKLVLADLVDCEKPWRHDSNKLAEALVSLYRGQRHSQGVIVSSPLQGVQRRAACP